jgi:hypothetical protein
MAISGNEKTGGKRLLWQPANHWHDPVKSWIVCLLTLAARPYLKVAYAPWPPFEKGGMRGDWVI